MALAGPADETTPVTALTPPVPVPVAKPVKQPPRASGESWSRSMMVRRYDSPN
jgi:hypothetical protein